MICPQDAVVYLPVDAHSFENGHAGNLGSDLTLYFRCTPHPSIADGFRTLSNLLGNRYSMDCEVQLYDQADPKRKAVGLKCRGLACWCDMRNSISVTLRSHHIEGISSPYPRRGLLAGVDHRHAAPYKELINILKPNPPAPLKGLIIVAGETGSGKSTLADIVFREMVRQAAPDHPHLIVLGKPVDWEPITPDCMPRDDNHDYKDYVSNGYERVRTHYTPRTIGVDTDLQSALTDALRQKPAGVYLDEIRKEADWKPVLHFAGTGHFMVTTTHGGCVKDVITWVLKSLGVERRSQIPSYLANVIAVIHVVKRTNTEYAPEVWLGKRGIAYLAAYGLAALVPQDDPLAPYISRSHFE